MTRRKRGRRLRLEATHIAGLEAEGGVRTDYADTLRPGLVLRVTPRGVRTWALRYRVGPRARWLKLGRWPTMTLAEARRAARRARGRVDAGEDPHAERVAERQARAVARRELTLGAVIEAFSRHLQSGGFSRSIRVQWPQMARKDLVPRLGHLRPEDPGVRAAVVAAVDGVMRRGAPAQANRTLELARRLWRWGVERGLIPVTAPYPFLALRRPHRAHPRERWYSPDEIRALWAAVAAEPPVYRDWWRMLWWTGARPSEVAEMRWEELELQTGRWTRLRTKGRRPLVLTLPRQALDLLRSRRVVALGLIFRSPRKPSVGLTAASRWHMAERLRRGRPVKPPPGARRRGSWRWSRTAGVVADYRHHDIRRTVRTGLAELGVRYEIAEMVLGHSRGGVTETYDRHLYQAEIAEALQRWADRLDEVTTSERR